jgi:hypothetical protein
MLLCVVHPYVWAYQDVLRFVACVCGVLCNLCVVYGIAQTTYAMLRMCLVRTVSFLETLFCIFSGLFVGSGQASRIR